MAFVRPQLQPQPDDADPTRLTGGVADEPLIDYDTRLSDTARATLWGLLIVALAAAAVAPSLPGGFLDQDQPRISDNLLLRSWSGLRPIWRQPHHLPDFSPLGYTTHLLEARLWGPGSTGSAAGYRLVNLMLHAATAVLLWRLLRTLAMPGAGVAAALFAVHPATVSTAAWLSQRSTLLGTLLGVATLIVLLRATKQTRPADDERRWYHLPASPVGLWCLSGLLTALTLAASPALAALLGPILLLFAWWRGGELSRGGKVAVGLLLALTGAVTAGAVLLTARATPAFGAIAVEGVPEALRPVVAGVQWAAYLAMTLWPVNLRFAYAAPDLNPATLGVAALLMAGAIGWAVWALRRGRRAPAAGVLAFTLLILPHLIWVEQTTLYGGWYAPHRLYPAAAVVIAGLTATAATAMRRRGWLRTPISARAPPAWAAAAVVAILGVLGAAHADVYRSEGALWHAVLEAEPTNHIALLRDGQRLLRAGDETAAERAFVQAGRLRPRDPAPLLQLGALHSRRAVDDPSRRQRARDAFVAALAIDPGNVEAMRGLASALQLMGDSTGALRQLEAARALRPRDPLILNDIGFAHFQRGEIDLAAAAYARAVEIDPRCSAARINLATLQFQQGRLDAADRELTLAAEADPTNWQTFMNAGAMLGQYGQYPKSAALLRHAARLNDQSPEVWGNLGMALLGWAGGSDVGASQRLALLGEAAFAFGRASELAPGNQTYFQALQEVRRRRAEALAPGG